MSYQCNNCLDEFDTLTKKRLHDCPGAPIDDHELPEALTDLFADNIPTLRETMPDGLNADGVESVLPILTRDDAQFIVNADVVAASAATEDGYFLLAFNGREGSWFVLERNDIAPEFTTTEEELVTYLRIHNDRSLGVLTAYESNDPDFPQFGV